MKKVDISVIIPMYRAQKTVRAAIDSILSQPIENLEIICVDDGSDDSTPQIVKEYADKDSRIVLISQKNLYAGVARNNGLDRAQGEYVTFLDADDTFLDGALQKMYAQAKKHDLDFLKAGFVYLDTKTNEKYRTLYSMNSAIGAFDRGRILDLKKKPLRLLNIADVPWNAIYKRSFLAENGIRFNTLQCVNDHSFFIDCLLKAKRIMVKEYPVALYRVEQSDSLVGGKAKNFENQIASYHIVKKLCCGADEKLRKTIMERELYGIFSWYTGFGKQNENFPELTQKMKEFLLEFDESDVTKDFIESFAYSKIYYDFKYGTAPNKQPGKIKKALDCYKEHGLKYTIARLTNKERKYKSGL